MTIDFKTKFHRDGSVTYWDVYKQEWRRVHTVTERILATLPESERQRILRNNKRNCNITT